MGERDTGWLLAGADDRTVIGRAIDGDAQAFAVLVRRYTPMMRAYTRRILGSSADVDDVVQESFVAAWQRLPQLEDPGSVKSWLMRTAGRKAVDRVRSRRPTDDIAVVEASAPDHRSPVRVAEAHAEMEALGAALERLPAAQRECWVLREVSGFSYEEIAETLGTAASTVRGLLARARKEIMVRMEEWR